jgi:putative spermidine/putrescine transport system ATP-binding protein
VFNEGRIAQVGTPSEIYERPATRFVADFVGSSNVLPPEVATRFGGAAAWASLRPEALRLTAPDGGVVGTVTATRYLGAGTRVGVDIGGLEVSAIAPAGADVPPPGARVGLAWAPGALHVMEAG